MTMHAGLFIIAMHADLSRTQACKTGMVHNQTGGADVWVTTG
jgi:hypothetical protein